MFVLWIMTIESGGLGRLIGMIRPSGGDSLPSLLHWTLFSTDQIKDDSFFNSEGLVFHFTQSGGTCMEVTCVYIKGIRVQHKIWRNDCQLLGFFLHQPSGLRMEQSVKSFTFRKEWHVNKFLHFHSFFEGYLKYLSIGK